MTRIRLPLAAAFSLAATAAFGHPGHVEEVAGHTHWLGWGAAAAALLVVAGALVLGYRAVLRRNR
ncbi:MAG: hypothetical protein JJ926_10250 [Roseitalea sp.]|jgi:hypothetical protein|uniref:Uncharacterized protein n=1 Tax=Oceaniradius stylonematis TaxID=2184161 RepID=A0A3A8AIN9_9HYPH|nr:DUF6732 family protein [Oceaniradius stylonematis]MBO6551369.1 hypothetical protein [Roseitalea sp.]MBO6952251.1 hypothetical protein [Rhizobiaceae bacterium]RNC90720.1 MAG: hypothetical protein ED558_17145 [Oricola sp.]MBO6591903.1 hypothetical protein [Roseitalea sp.]MBO6598158.1 hypothetical protein [Roseitalea sp.]